MAKDNPVQTLLTTAIRRPAWFVGGVTFMAYCLLALIVLANQPAGVLAFAHIGTRFSLGDPTGTTGYDGQFAYFIARDGAEAVPYIDGPTLRYQRSLYPVVARVLAVGQAGLVPWMLLLVNLVAHSMAAGLLAHLIQRLGGQPFSAFVYSAWIGNLFAVRFDLNEPLCLALALAGVVAYQRERYRWAIFALILATAAKELGLVFAAGLALHAALVRGQWRWASLIAGGPLAFFLAWWGVMRLWLGRLPLGYPAAKLHLIPFEGLFSDRVDAVNLVLLSIWLALPTLALGLAALRVLWRDRAVSLGLALLIPSAGFVATMPDVSWQDPVAAYRVALPIVPAGLLFVAEHARRRWRLLAAVWVPAALLALLVPGLW